MLSPISLHCLSYCLPFLWFIFLSYYFAYRFAIQLYRFPCSCTPKEATVFCCASLHRPFSGLELGGDKVREIRVLQPR